MAKVVKSLLLISLVLLIAFTYVSFVPMGESAMAANTLWTDYASDSLEGNGSSGSPYLVKSGADLARFSLMISSANDVNKFNIGGSNGTYYKLNQDIDLSLHQFSPIKEFRANLDGNGYVISNLNIDNNTDYTGLFTSTNNTSIIQNLGLYNVSILGSNYVGGIVGSNGGQITKSFVNGNIKGEQYVGSIAGQSTGTISYSYTLGNISAKSSHVGGIVGNLIASGSVLNSYTSTSILASGSYTGAIIGMMSTTATTASTYYNNSLNSIRGIGGINAANPTDGNTIGINKYLISGISALNTMTLNPNGIDKVFLAESANTDAILSSPTLSIFRQSQLSLDSSKTYLFGGYNSNNTEIYGSESHPFLISNTNQFFNLSLAVNNNEQYKDKVFLLTNDLDFKNTPFSAIGNYSTAKYFNGVFDGKNYTIKNINYLAPTLSYVGVFGYNRGTIKNINLDESNVLTGANFVGALAGANEGNLINIFSSAKISGIDYVGGIAGRSSGLLQDILVVSIPTAVSNGYGIVGELISNPNIKNSWYLNKNKNYTHNQGGSVLTVDNNGSVSASKDNDGKIEFLGTPSGGFATEFRNKSESRIAEGYTFVPDKTSSASYSYFARFVKPISFDIDQSKYTVTGLNASGYYDGQTVGLTLTIRDSYYLSYFGLANAILSNKGSSRDIEVQFVMSSSTESISPVVTAIGAVQPISTIYNKQPQTYSYSLSGYDVNIAYSTGSAPIDAGEHTVMLTVSKDGVKIGYTTMPIVINKLDITNYTLDTTSHLSKEFDNSLDSILLPTLVKFDENLDGANVTMSVRAKYNSINIGVCDVTLSFSLSGSAKNNYNAPSNTTASGKILPKNLVISIEDKDLVKTYDTLKPYIGFYSATAIPSKANLTYTFVFISDTDSSRKDTTKADTYSVSIVLSGDDSVFYSAKLESEYKYVISPKEVTVSYIGTANQDGSNLIYKNDIYTITAKYTDSLSITQVADIKCYLASDESLATTISVKNVNTYTAVASISDPNYSVSATTAKHTFDVIKAAQSTISIQPFANPVTYGDIDLVLSLDSSNAGSGTGDVKYFILSGFGIIEGSNLVLTGGGDIIIIATKLTDDNYLEAVSEPYVLNVAKKQLNIITNTLIFDYSDKIVLDYTFDGYAYADSGIPNGFVAPTIMIQLKNGDSIPLDQLETLLNVGDYTLLLQNNASSDGYFFNYGDNKYTLVILRKDIIIVPETTNQPYGSDATEINFVAEGLTTTLNGKLSRSNITNINVGIYDIISGTLTNDNNPNYNISLTVAKYHITPSQLTITMNKANKIFGDADPIPTYMVAGLQYDDLASTVVSGSASRIVGEDAYTVLSDTSRNYAYTVGSLKISDNYELNFVANYLTIFQKIPAVIGSTSVNVQYGDKLSSVKLNLSAENISGNTTWADANIVPTYDNSGYMAIFKPFNNNYAAVNIKFDVNVVRREIYIDFIGAKDVNYTGQMHKHITYKINNALQGDELGDVLTFVTSDIAADKYQATLTISNTNYIIKGASSLEYVVNPAKLIISVEDINIDQGQTVTPIFRYKGFVNNENKEVLKTQPQITIPRDAGNYSIAPYGASSDNYKIEYVKANITVNKTLAHNIDNNINMVGKFDVDMIFDIKEIRSGEERTEFNKYADTFKTHIETNGLDTNGGALQKIYKFNLTAGGKPFVLKGTTTIKMEVASKFLSRANISVAIFRKDGSAELINDVTISGKEITFKVDGDIDSIALVTPPDYTLPIVGGISALLIILVFILDAISEKLGIGRHKKKKQ